MKCAGGSATSMALGKQNGISCVNLTATVRRTCCLLNLRLLVSGLGSSVRHRVLRSCPTLHVPPSITLLHRPEMDVNREEGLDGEHARPGIVWFPNPLAQPTFKSD